MAVSVCEGASSGIGAEAARVLALRGVHVVMAVRSLEAADKVKGKISQQVHGAKVDAMKLDLSSMESVRRFANVGSNNAGVMATLFTLSKDGIELQFATNHIGHFLLTNLLLDSMKKTASKSQIEGRIINVSSRYSMLSAYGQSKLAYVLHANELSPQSQGRWSISHCKLTSSWCNCYKSFPASHHCQRSNGLLRQVLYQKRRTGSSHYMLSTSHPEVKGISGKYFADSNLATASDQANDAELGKKLWDFSLKITK